MNPFQHLPLGRRIPDSPHGVSVSLPTVLDVIEYEEKEPRTMARICSGYPRFVQHEYIRNVIDLWREDLGLGVDQTLYPVCSAMAAEDLLVRESLGGSARSIPVGSHAVLVVDAGDADTRQAIGAYVQHTGCGLSSREAEDLLVVRGKLPEVFREDCVDPASVDAASVIGEWFANRVSSKVILCKSGMNAFYAAFQAVNDLQYPKGRRQWLSSGWLYLDTIRVIDRYCGRNGVHHQFRDPTSAGDLLAHLAREGSKVAGVILEMPTNPLVQTADIAPIAEACRKAGVILLLDPSVVSPQSVDVSPWCDLIPCSLTKYAAHAGDVMIGAVSVNMDRPDGPALAEAIMGRVHPPYARDLGRLLHSMEDSHENLERIHQNTMHLAEYFSGHRAVASMHWAYHPASADAYRRIERKDSSPGSILTLRLNGELKAFYDALPLSKGPSFGMSRTLACPHIMLAHYDLVQSEPGRAQMALFGIHPDLVRISIGVEPVDALEALFSDALDRL